MIRTRNVFSSFSVDDLGKAKSFYAKTVGLKVESIKGMGLKLHLKGGGNVYLYERKNHKPATYTVLNLEVNDIDEAVGKLKKQGIKMERYKGMPQDKDGIMRGISKKMGPDIAWFEDPAGNIISVLKSPS
jgi:predicted enzyme related to lactoylglutathione lyase